MTFSNWNSFIIKLFFLQYLYILTIVLSFVFKCIVYYYSYYYLIKFVLRVTYYY